jgi:hypothetical protein
MKQARTAVEGASMFVTTYSTTSPIKVSLRCRDFEEPCSRSVLGPDYYLKEIIVYDANNRPFAVRAVLAGADPRHDGVSARDIKTFLDNDGDGIFETYSETGFGKLSIPIWARK